MRAASLNARMRGLAFAALAFAVAGCSGREGSVAGEPPIPFQLSRLGGGSLGLESYRGKLVLLDFWATWCPPCVAEVPELNAFYEAHRASGVEVLGIAVDGDAPELERFANEHGVAYPIAIGSAELAQRYGGTAFPFHVLVSREGQVLERLEPGYHDRDELAELIARHASPGP